ncbi:MAG: TniQ family protein [Methylophilaceae bacterium]|nr:TniQ family protein [Methyloradius sp.]
MAANYQNSYLANIHKKRLNLDLFDGRDTPIVKIRDDETIYSWCARIHRLSSCLSPNLTCQQLFGHHSSGLRHDLPGYIRHLVDKTYCHQTAESLAVNHTVLGFFKPFLPKHIFNQYIDTMLNSLSLNIRRCLASNLSHQGVPFPLKMCLKCVSQFREIHGYTYWNIRHQSPHLQVCIKHRDYLLVAPDEFHQLIRHQWVLPDEVDIKNWGQGLMVSTEALAILESLEKWLASFEVLGDQPLDPSILRVVYLMEFNEKGYASHNGAKGSASTINAFKDQYQSVFNLRGFDFLRDVDQYGDGVLEMVLKQRPLTRYPLKHMFALDFLFDTPSDFFKQYFEINEYAIKEFGL